MLLRSEGTIVILLVLSLVGCGPNCQDTCQRLYGNGANAAGEPDCLIDRPGRSQTELISTCMDHCENALDNPGELEGYDPYTRQGSNTSIELENERQAALWMDCVAENSCDRLEEGYCAPVW